MFLYLNMGTSQMLNVRAYFVYICIINSPYVFPLSLLIFKKIKSSKLVMIWKNSPAFNQVDELTLVTQILDLLYKVA